ncbi:Hypothetical predicted protein [Lynx pardinus]|uniref:Uncharacterized protein n=1 Tax=Lynx pardinus TaxID=191816 RepID=A0A485NYX4_LYNPA|nr:Hypothetical predicted protein [Lynx pardinus]
MISWFVGLSPMLGSVLAAQSLKPASDSVSPSLSARPLLVLCLLLMGTIFSILLVTVILLAFCVYKPIRRR